MIFGIEDLSVTNLRYKKISNDIVENDIDVCIIGSGAAGGVLAKELVEAGKSVILIEKGGYHEGKDMNQREVDMMPLLWKNSGLNFDENLRIAIAQGCCLGGSTIINDAVCFDTPKKIQDKWRNLGVDFSEEEWYNSLNKVNKMINVKQVTEDELNRNNRMLREGAKKIGMKSHWNNFRNCKNCMQCGFCHIGCHYETKQNVLITYIDEALKQSDDRIKVYCNCDIDTITYENNLVSGVEGNFRDIDGKKIYRIRINSKIIILSCGAIASSELLLKNRIGIETAGRGLALHPGIEVIGDFDYEIKGYEGIPMAYTIHDFGITRKSDETIIKYNYGADSSGANFLIESIFLPFLQFSISLSPAGIQEYRNLIKRLNNYAMAGIVVQDGNNGQISLTSNGRARVSYELQEKELKALAKGVEVLATIWFELGAKKIIIPHRETWSIEDPKDIPKMINSILYNDKKLYVGSAHPQSGNKIGIDPKDSVVDSDCKVHGFKNLFVCDASVFPTSVGVNPQVTVMTVASITASRIIQDWELKYANLMSSDNIGKTCHIQQPMYCLRHNLSQIFDAQQTKPDLEILLNSANEHADETNWSFDPKSMLIYNNSHWKGIFPRDENMENLVTLYFGGFWKRFTKNNSEITGITHPFELPIYAHNKTTFKTFGGFGKIILLEYSDPLYNRFYDVLKVINKDTIIGKAFFGNPMREREIMTFSMSRKYPLEFMTEEDHEMLYKKAQKPSLEALLGVWEGQLVSDSQWTPPIFRFKYYFGNQGNNELKCDYIFGNILAGTATISEKEDHIEMRDVSGIFHDELKQINNNIMIGKYCSESNEAYNWIPDGFSFLHIDRAKPNLCLPYVIKKVGPEPILKNSSIR